MVNIFFSPRGKIIKDSYMISLLNQSIYKVRAHKSCAARYKIFQKTPLDSPKLPSNNTDYSQLRR
jgi:hypothetical protein